MPRQLRFEPEERVPADASVCHYDELGERAKERLPALVADGGPVAVDGPVAAEFGDYVKFTSYYRVSED